MIMIDDVVKVNNITTGKLESGVLGFTYGKKGPDKGSLVKYANSPKPGIYNYRHHMSQEAIDELYARFPNEIPDKGYYEIQNGKHYLKLWGKDLKKAIAEIMKRGDFIIERETEEGVKRKVGFVWEGEVPEDFKV